MIRVKTIFLQEIIILVFGVDAVVGADDDDAGDDDNDYSIAGTRRDNAI